MRQSLKKQHVRYVDAAISGEQVADHAARIGIGLQPDKLHALVVWRDMRFEQ
ncbi:MAG TPA: hypothetical protein VHU23_00740 [Rhizomicrobium sp.]|jgi:hypothetical protein|nr:hypothetical protein [Rhizomicrobium sp.]